MGEKKSMEAKMAIKVKSDDEKKRAEQIKFEKSMKERYLRYVASGKIVPYSDKKMEEIFLRG